MKDEHTYGEKIARYGRTKVIYKGTFISKQSLLYKIHQKISFYRNFEFSQKFPVKSQIFLQIYLVVPIIYEP